MNNLQQNKKYTIATAIAILFHTIGLIGILFFEEKFFIQATPYNLLLMFGLLIWTQKNKNFFYYSFLLLCIIIGITVEIIGVNTGLLFGKYSYGKVLGITLKAVPLVIGINWFIIMYCCGISMHTLLLKIIQQIPVEKAGSAKKIKALSVIIDGATLAAFFDWIMEPAAIKLGYWQWHGDGAVPLFNYVSWFIVSVLLLTGFHFLQFNKSNKFAVNLLLIQLMFFLLLRTFN